MSDMKTPGDGRKAGPDAHGQAALLVTEALMHLLIEKGILSAGDALAIIHTSSDVKEEIISAGSEPRENALASMALLTKMSLSFAQIQVGGGDGGDGAGLDGHGGDGYSSDVAP